MLSSYNKGIGIFFTADSFEGKIKNKESNKSDDSFWFNLNNRPNSITPCIKKTIKSKKDYSETKWK